MQFTSLKAFLKPGTMFRSSNREWTVDRVEYADSESSTPRFWWGGTRRLGNLSWTPISVSTDGLSDYDYNSLTITRVGGAPIQLEDLI